MKRCIFHLPYELDPQASRARMVRPRKMIRAFQELGYEVFEITGYAAARKQKIAEVKKLIRSGVRFDFAYSEASTMPTLLTEPNHLPTHPFLDFGFFRYLKKQGIPIGLFYPDIYWKFENYGDGLPAWKRFFALKNYELDIHEYEKYLDRFYIPSLKLCDYLQSSGLSKIAEELPPGADDLVVSPRSYEARDFDREPLTVIYVGGIGAHYQISELLRAVNTVERCRLILCCREQEWEKEKDTLAPLLSDKIEVVHKSGSELSALYEQSDVASLLFKENRYMNMAKPVKAYEYLAYELPMLATEGTGIGRFVREARIGFTMNYSAEAIANTLHAIVEDPGALASLHESIMKAKEGNSWKARAEQVALGLKPLGKAK